VLSVDLLLEEVELLLHAAEVEVALLAVH